MDASLPEIKKVLEKQSKAALLTYCLRLARLKKENKELLAFILFDSENIALFIQKAEEETRVLFSEINMSNVYFIKKSVRKILRMLNKYIRFSQSKEVEAELLICFCKCMKDFKIPAGKSKQLDNLFNNQYRKISAVIKTLHPDLQYDLNKKLAEI